MPALRFIPLPSAAVAAVRSGGADANGQPAERRVSDDDRNHCRHCLVGIARGAPMLVLAWRPFAEPQPYAELGPIFLHAEPCERHDEARIPALLTARDSVLLRGYDARERIVYGTGRTVPGAALAAAATELLARPETAFVHVRSATNNCYQCRVERGVEESPHVTTLD